MTTNIEEKCCADTGQKILTDLCNCPCHSPHQLRESLREEFEDWLINYSGPSKSENVADWWLDKIHSLLEAERARLKREVEKLDYDEYTFKEEWRGSDGEYSYNLAINDVLSLLTPPRV